ncbi:MAG: hypothetical protein R2697_21465 [Ilumatobacteraceae bacterium]
MGLKNDMYFRGGPWKQLNAMSFDDRLAAIHDEAFVAELVEQAKQRPTKTPRRSSSPRRRRAPLRRRPRTQPGCDGRGSR